ncbi:MAG: alpha/beta hydrolase fold domain-containing protein [Hyphomonadaceae bacterium]
MRMLRNGLVPLTALALAACAHAPLRQTDEARLQPAWQALDADKDGVVKLTELQPLMMFSLRPHDANGDGAISLAEYVSFDLDPNREGQIPLGENVRLIANLDYAGTGDPRQTLDIYLPKSPNVSGPLPVLAYIHGGGWTIGSKIMGRDQTMGIANSGRYAVISIGYRLSWQDAWPAQIDDAKAAIRWIRAHAKEYNLDPGRICAMGVSAGGHIAAKLGLTNGVAADEGKVGHYLDQSSAVKCVVSESSPTDLRLAPVGTPNIDPLLGSEGDRAELARRASPVLDVSAGDPPFLIIHGNKDPFVPFQQAVEFEAALRAAGVPVLFQTIDGGGHGGFTGLWPKINERIRLFLDRNLYDPATQVPTDTLKM